MTTYTVAYDLNKAKDYPRLWAELGRLGGHRTQDSHWLLTATSTDAKSFHNDLKSFVDNDDSIQVSELTLNHYYTNAKVGTNAWISSNRPARQGGKFRKAVRPP